MIIAGCVITLIGFFNTIGVWLGGYLYDTNGSYDIVWWSGVGLALVATPVHLPINESPLQRLHLNGEPSKKSYHRPDDCRRPSRREASDPGAA